MGAAGSSQSIRRFANGVDAELWSAAGGSGDPGWPPDGRSVAIAAKYNGAPRLMQVPVDGKASTVLTGEYAMDSAWSVAFLQGDIDHKNIWEMDLDSEAQRQLTDLPVGV